MSTAHRVEIQEPIRHGRDPLPPARPDGESAGMLPYLRLFWDHRRFIFRAGAIALAASVALALLIPTRFQAVTRLMPPDSSQTSSLGMLAAIAGKGSSSVGGLGALAGDMLGLKSSGALFIGILGSETVQDRIINEFDLREIYGGLGGKMKIEDARKELAQHTELTEDRKSGIVTINFTDHQPQRAADIAQAYVWELNRTVAQVSTSAARREREFLELRLQSVKSELDASARKFSDFASKNTAIDIPAQGKAMVEAAAVLQGQLIASQAQLSGLQQIYSDNNVRVRAARARVDELQKKLNEVGGADTASGAISSNGLFPSIRKLPILGVTYADLYRQNKIEETVFELLTQQYELAKVQEAKEIPTVKVLDPALVPTKKSFPPRTEIVLLGTAFGIALAMTWLVGKSWWQTIDAGDPQRALAIEVFSTIRSHVPRFIRNGSNSDSARNSSEHWLESSSSEGGSKPEEKNG